ncbi:hypothetical protein ACWDNT_25270, partial [Streptomyces sp. NPDC000963]
MLAAQSVLVMSETGAAFAVPQGNTDRAVAADPGRQAGAKPAASSAGSVAAALLMARVQGRKIEVVSQRSSVATTYALPDGQMQTTTYAAPVRQKGGGPGSRRARGGGSGGRAGRRPGTRRG